MNEEQPLSAAQKAQIATRIGELDHQIAQKDSSLRNLEQQLANTKGRKQAPIETQIAALREERSAILQEANTLRAQIGAPMVIGGPVAPAPQQTVVVQAPPKKRRGRGCLLLIGALVAIGAIIIAMNLGGGSGSQSAANVSPTQIPKMNEDVQVGDVRWKVLEAVDEGPTLKGTELTQDKTTSGKWVRVRLEVENLGKDLRQFSDVELIDDQGRSFKKSDDFEVYMRYPENERCNFLDQLNPNLPKTCSLIFELPADAKGLKTKLGDLDTFGNKEAQVEIGF